MSESAQASERRFDRFTERDASLVRWQYGRGYVAELSERWYRMMFHGGRRVLDVGCGTGAAAVWADGAEYFGIDLSGAWVCQGRDEPDRTLAVASVVSLPFPDGCFDRVVCSGMLHHLACGRAPAALGEMARVLKKGGEVAILEPNPWNPWARLFAYVKPAERGILHTSARHLRRAIASVPEVRVETFSYEHSAFWPTHLTFYLRRWSWVTGCRMTRFFNLVHKVGRWLMPRPVRACTFWRLCKQSRSPNGSVAASAERSAAQAPAPVE